MPEPRPLAKTPIPFGISEGGRADIDLLHGISIELIAEQDHVELYGKIVDAAVAITGSQFGTMQLLCPQGDPSGNGGKLNLLCSRGLPEEAVEFWRWVGPEAHSTCINALKSGQREIVPDYEDWDVIAGTEDLLAFRRSGIRSAQTTPLLSRDGTLLGMISTHWSEPHVPSDRDLRLLDILARQAADLLERTIAEEARRAREQELDRTCATLREAKDLQKLLTAELSHRVKNMLATVQAIASQTLRHCDDPADFVTSFGGRIQSMSRVHSQLSINDWKGTGLHDIVRDQMKFGPVDEAQVSASGPAVYIDATHVPMMAMILHELGTNSLKYGALSKKEGTVKIAWSVSDQGLDLCWTEQGGPAVAQTLKRGFGTNLIESTARGVGGEAKMLIEVDGVRWNITLPISADQTSSRTTSEASALEVPSPNHDASGLNGQTDFMRLDGKRILIVEDEPMVAMDIAGQLEDAGATVIGPAGNASAALTLIEQYRFDGALLDANLGGHPVGDIAASLKLKNIPFAFVSGYNRDSLPLSFDEVELLSKPFSTAQLLAAVAKIVS
ncbi:HWE histidine kinase domain-containing protein [Sphingomonas sp. 10B4]|uniref:HWE histidine kinase domain-containing protein n=1 Tax=Sphingomonas sp. 10B4 TaxID=3048575 RepID=UPI002AB46A60|nr:HWE histidine kinase domain-containing protein [Sphingomonas sp. 10B4]MDY7522793.1 HWE histidine kinase domain-containing protein [Sphingomonas sp. 10B4]MEB0284573.1 HWE histidine kinase domain-containing protein [Sphingomonas sp. 10B4]